MISIAHARGYEATSVGYQGLSGTADHKLLLEIIGGDFTFVTNNRRDFLRLYRVIDIHAGLLIILPAANRDRQRQLFTKALDAIAAAGADLTGVLVEIGADGEVVFSHYPPTGGNE